MARPKVYDEDLRHRLLACAAECLAAAGPEQLSLRALAAAAATSTNAVYTMFGDKAGLVQAVLHNADRGLADAERAVLSLSPCVEDIVRICLVVRRWAVAHPALYAVMFSGPGQSTHAGVGWAEAQSTAPLLDVVTALVGDGSLRSANPTWVTTSIWASSYGMIALELALWPNAGGTAERAYRAHLQAVVRGWLPGGPGCPGGQGSTDQAAGGRADPAQPQDRSGTSA